MCVCVRSERWCGGREGGGGGREGGVGGGRVVCEEGRGVVVGRGEMKFAVNEPAT